MALQDSIAGALFDASQVAITLITKGIRAWTTRFLLDRIEKVMKLLVEAPE